MRRQPPAPPGVRTTATVNAGLSPQPPAPLMRNNPNEISYVNVESRTRRIWYGHGKSRLVTESSPDVAPANAIDEAMAGFDLDDAAHTPRPQMNSLVADLSAQLIALDRQRNHLARLLRDINNA
jgi:hypothetical protein